MIILKSLSNDIDLADPSKSSYFLVFESTDLKKTFRLPVSEETATVVVQELIAPAASATKTEEKAPATQRTDDQGLDDGFDDETQFATTFGGDEGSPPVAPFEGYDPYEDPDLPTRPATEDEVPPL